MKRWFTVFVLAGIVSGCMTYPYEVKDGGDGVYYAESAPVYTYVNMPFGFPYYGPYAWSWYYPVWHPPYAGSHYSWYRPYHPWSHPFSGVDSRIVQNRMPRGDWPYERRARRSPSEPAPSLSPLDLRMGAIEPRVSQKRRYPSHYPSAIMKQRMAAKGYRTTKPAHRVSGQSPRVYSSAPKPSSGAYRSAPKSSPPPRMRSSARSKDIRNEK